MMVTWMLETVQKKTGALGNNKTASASGVHLMIVKYMQTSSVQYF